MDPRPKAHSCSADSRARRGATRGNSTISADIILELVARWSGQQHLDCVKYQGQFVPYLWGHVSGLRQLMSWPRSGHQAVNVLPRWGFSPDRSAHRSWLRRRARSHEEELKVPDYAQRWNLYYLVSFDCSPSFLHFLTSLIIFCLKFFYRQRQAEDWGRPAASCCVSGSVSTPSSHSVTHSSQHRGAAHVSFSPGMDKENAAFTLRGTSPSHEKKGMLPLVTKWMDLEDFMLKGN